MIFPKKSIFFQQVIQQVGLPESFAFRPNPLKYKCDCEKILLQMAGGSVKTKNILIVDDQENVAMILASSLSKFQDCGVEVVYNGRDAVEMCRQQFFDLVVADYQLPDLSGIQVAVMLQEISPKTKIILITALRVNMIDESIEQDNIHYFLEKPFPLQQFLDVIQEAFENVT